MENVAEGKKYQDMRKSFEKKFKKYPSLLEEREVHHSPSGNYDLIVIPYETGKGFWNYTKGIVYNKISGEEVHTVYRNYGSFPFQWIEHQNGNEYLLCGEDYQGYVTLNLTEKKKHVYYSENAFKGWGWCWVEIKEYDKEYDTSFRVEGCAWGAPFEIVEYDFKDPDTLPYKELSCEDVDYPEDPDCWGCIKRENCPNAKDDEGCDDKDDSCDDCIKTETCELFKYEEGCSKKEFADAV